LYADTTPAMTAPWTINLSSALETACTLGGEGSGGEDNRGDTSDRQWPRCGDRVTLKRHYADGVLRRIVPQDVRSWTRFLTVAASWLLGLTWFALALRSAIGGHYGIDARTFYEVWRAPRLYSASPRTTGAFLYSPVFAQVLWPLTQLSWILFAWLWLALGAATYLWLVAPMGWRLGIPMLALGVEDLRIGQATWLLALSCVLGMRRPSYFAVGLLTKITPGVGLVWYAVRREWGALGWAAAATALLAGMSAAIRPDLWIQWLHLLMQSARGAGTLPIRLALSVAILWVGRSRRWPVPIAVMVALPVGGLHSIGLLCAVPRLARAGGGQSPSAISARV
jgi:hypothetical protein